MTRARIAAGAALSVLLALPLAGRAQAQNSVITGRVTTEFGQPLEGANVYIAEMTISVATNSNGGYTITIPAARAGGQQIVLRARAFGYIPQARPIRLTSGSQSVDFSLKQDVNRLQEVVVTGVTAGTEQKKLAFSVAHVDESQMPVPAANPLTQLQGKVPGAQIVSTTGRPGSAPAVLLRGPKSINGQGRGQSPLYIVDGIELQGTLADINPQDIESVEVVKGAAASSLYGSRAGNGVIQITTKSGKNVSEGVRFNVRTEYGGSDIERAFPLARDHFVTMDETQTRFCVDLAASITCGRTVNFEEEALRVNQNANEVALTPQVFNMDGGIARNPGLKNLRNVFQVNLFPRQYDPVSDVVTPGQFVNSSVDASGKAGGTSFFASASNLWQQGAIKYLSGFKRNSLRLNVDQNVGSNVTLGVRSYYSRGWQDGANQEQGNAFFRVTRVPAGVDLTRLDNLGRLFIRSNPLNQGDQNYNPLYDFQNARQTNTNDRFLGSMTASYTPTSWLTFDANGSYDRTNSSLYFVRDNGFRVTNASNITTTLGFTQRNGGYSQSYNASVNGTASKSWGSFNTRYTLRYLYEQQDGLSTLLFGSNLAVPNLTTAGAAIESFGIGSSETSIRSIGATAGVDADWKDRYILGALIRRDGSSLFGQQNRWANYGRVSAAWRVAAEPWWFAPTAVNELKLRASYGTAGGRPSFAAQYEAFSIGTGGAVVPQVLGNKKLRPETVGETELGLDAEFFARYGLNVTYARDIATDQILPVRPPAASGFDTQWLNAGTLDNKTWEVSVNVPLVQRRNVSWSTRVNYDRTRSTITKLDVPPFFGGTTYQNSDKIFRFAAGERYAEFYGRKFVTSCGELPSTFQSQCGSGKAFQRNSDGFIVWVGAGNALGDGITKNLWNAVLPGAQAPWGQATNWGMPFILRDSTGTGRVIALGNALPDYRLGVSQTFNFKKLFVYALADGSFGQYIWNQGRAWSYGDFMNRDEDQRGKSIADAKPIGYYWRAPSPDGAGVGGLYDFLGVNSGTLEKSSYWKLREVTVSYNIGAVAGTGDWTIGLTGRNLKTFTNYTGFDPEVGTTANSNVTGTSALAAVDNYNFPNTRTYTISLSTKF